MPQCRRSSTASCTTRRWPWRKTSSGTVCPGGVSAATLASAESWCASVPPILRMTSFSRIPARSAGLPTTTPVTTIPCGASSPNLSAVSFVTDWHRSPTALLDVTGYDGSGTLSSCGGGEGGSVRPCRSCRSRRMAEINVVLDGRGLELGLGRIRPTSSGVARRQPPGRRARRARLGGGFGRRCNSRGCRRLQHLLRGCHQCRRSYRLDHRRRVRLIHFRQARHRSFSHRGRCLIWLLRQWRRLRRRRNSSDWNSGRRRR